MLSPSTNLLLYYLGFGYVLFLMWGIVLVDAVKSDPPRWIGLATTTLLLIGILHPAAALAAWDLRRYREPSSGRVTTGAGLPALVVILSIAVAGAVVITTGMGEL